MGRPRTKKELLDLINHYKKVRGVGVGHSWWQEQFCAGEGDDSIEIVTTEINEVLDMYAYPKLVVSGGF